jgi:putative adhesin
MGTRGTGSRVSVAGAVAAGLVAAAALAGCGEISQARLDFSNTEKVAITEVRISGGSGDVTVSNGAAGEVRIDRQVRYRGSEPAKTYRIEGTVLYVDTDCGNRCGVTYAIHAPVGVAVRGESHSGNVYLTKVSTVDVRVSSGNVSVTEATGDVRVEASSGDIQLTDITGGLSVDVSSGQVEGSGLGGKPIRVTTSSGDVTLRLDRPADVTADVNSGNIELFVPGDRYRVDTNVGSGNVDLAVTDDPAAPHTLKLTVDSGDITVHAR